MWKDDGAAWREDALYLPPVDVSKLPMNIPTGGWEQIADTHGTAVSVPGTVEEYRNGETAEGQHGSLGVSWWWRTIHIPSAASASHYVLKFAAVRHRAEIYLDRRLVGYDLIGNSPFDVDLSPFVKPGQDCILAVRVTNPGGGYSSGDTTQLPWGKYELPTSHGFGGVTGDVRLVATPDVFLDDIYVQNQPTIKDAKVFLTIDNLQAGTVHRDVLVRVFEKTEPAAELWHVDLKAQDVKPGASTVAVDVPAPGAKLWDLDHPNLYCVRAELVDGGNVSDAAEQTFGFRWFAPVGIGSDAMFRLNGKRVVLRTAISWGFWPFNGMFPTEELAQKQIAAAKQLGMNMLNFHRCIGAPIVLDKADEMGLFYFEEPGGYTTGGKDPFARAIAREKLLRMVKRDRSHPSLIIYNMINEQWDRFGADKDKELFARQAEDMRAAHDLDPSRTITYTSAWARTNDGSELQKMHMRPFDDAEYHRGWFDNHRAGGPATWQEEFYRGPDAHYGCTTDKKEIVYWGEEGAMSTPSRLGSIDESVRSSSYRGFDGDTWLRWGDETAAFLRQSKFDQTFPTVDAFCTNLGAASLEHQGRKIELTRICDLNDGYCINGWEDTLDDNHSSIVDCWRNPKAAPSIMAYYNQPLYVAVESRNLVARAGEKITVDFYAINEANLAGAFTLRVAVTDAAGAQVFTADLPVNVQGGDVFGQLLTAGLSLPASEKAGTEQIRAALVDAAGLIKATGREDVLVVDWKSNSVTGNGAVYEDSDRIGAFLKKAKGVEAAKFDGTQGKLDWLVLARPPFDQPTLIPAKCYVDKNGTVAGLNATFFKGNDFATPVANRVEDRIDFNCPVGKYADPSIAGERLYGIRWEGYLLPPATGTYHFLLHSNGADSTKFWLDGKQLLTATHADRDLYANADLEAGKAVKVRIDYPQRWAGGSVQLSWTVPGSKALDLTQVIRRAREDGTAVLIIDYTDTWMAMMQDAGLLQYGGRLSIGTNWTGGQYFNRPGPLFADLPANGVLGWPYEAVVQTGRCRYVLKLSGVEPAAAAWQSQPFAFGTAAAVVPCGKGNIVVSTFDICSNLGLETGPAQVARKLLCNYLQFATSKH